MDVEVVLDVHEIEGMEDVKAWLPTARERAVEMIILEDVMV